MTDGRNRYWLLLCLLGTALASAADPAEQRLQAVAFQQRIGQPVARIEGLADSAGHPQSLAALAQGQPLVLLLSWFDCPSLCPMLIDRLAEAVAALPPDFQDFAVAVVSIAPDEGAREARGVRQRLAARSDVSLANWFFLHGDKPAIDRLADSIGFRYAYDPKRDQYAHPAGLVIVAPGGRISHYLLGIQPQAPDLKLALLDASEGKLGSAVDQLLLRCYRFNSDTGQYNLAVMRVLRVVGVVFVIVLAIGLLLLQRRRRP